ncbi:MULTISPECIES: HNH/ENDO VII family nuclease, partial [unclassified Bartonella]|uniref:HNH/ENDO VII family nuclease n=1 Tax=unclassified Bartonella TaxID=2645622 RepID=UPI0035CFF2E9
ISTGQGISFGAGIVAGVPAEIYDTVDGFWQIAKHPKETLKALKDLFTSGEILATIGRTLGQSYVDRINKMEEEYERAGAGGSFNAGVEFGKLLTETASLMTGVAGAAKGGIKLAGKLVEKDLIEFAAKAEEAAITGAKVGATSSEVNTAHVGKEIAQSLEKMSDEAIATQYLGQERKFWSKPIEVGFEITNNGEKITQINKVYQSEKLFDPNRISEWIVNKKKVTGTNIERMKTGRAPIGFDNEPIELHHMLQTHDGPIAEVTNAFHNKHHSAIHINPNTMGSAIDRDAFALWRQKYWKERAKGYENKDIAIRK